uniref:Hsp90 chaperone protein kinase-targeting subunit n=1 Tax=Parascaris univalens TaxID=6257 RepID=A0A915A0M7_PARUN
MHCERLSVRNQRVLAVYNCSMFLLSEISCCEADVSLLRSMVASFMPYLLGRKSWRDKLFGKCKCAVQFALLKKRQSLADVEKWCFTCRSEHFA